MSSTTPKKVARPTWSAAELHALEGQRKKIKEQRDKENPENHELTLHLLAYNGISALMWSYILVMTIVSLTDSPTSTRGKAASLVSRVLGTESAPISSFIDRFRGTYNQEDAFKHAPLEWWVKWTQTLAVLEIVHAGLGWVRSPVGTVAAQVASRIWTVWGVVEAVPATHGNPLYTTMILAWSVTEIIRYTFYFFSVIGVNIPPLTYLRYSTFLLLYPIGAASEAFLSFSTLPPLSTLPFWPESLTAWSILNKLPDGWRKAVMKTGFGRSVVWKLAKAGAGAKKGVQGTWGWMEIVRLGIFFIWWPALYVMYTHMLKQRKRVLSKGRTVGTKIKTS